MATNPRGLVDLGVLTMADNQVEQDVVEEGIFDIDTELDATLRDAEDEDENSPEVDKIPLDLINAAAENMQISRKCTHCRQEGSVPTLCVCAGCGGRTFHKTCWENWVLHEADDGLEKCKEPTEFSEFVWIKHLLYSNISPEEQATLHRGDVWSTWFGVPHQQDDPKLYVYPRLQVLVGEANGIRDEDKDLEQYPSLISFFGDTGGGKSTIIRALIRNAALDDCKSGAVPIPGNSVDRHKSTSGDVHLYSDPATINTRVPLFYADCEGLRGAGVAAATRVAEGDLEFTANSSRGQAPIPGHGATVHKARQHQGRHFKEQTLRHARPITKFNKQALQKEVIDHRATVSQKHRLRWAMTVTEQGITALQDKTFVHPESRNRIVKDLYPRLLYTFSDVVCYITNNPRATEAELLHLFEWASSGHDRTLNQRVRPGLLIVVNKDVPTASEDWLDVDYATKTLLSHLELSAAFAGLRATWKKRGRILKTAEDLILCYYESFRIICIPNLDQTTTHQIAVQYKKLYEEVTRSSKRMRIKKKSVGMNLNVQSLIKYMDYAFERLARDWTSSIDFHYLASKDAVRPRKFREHMLATMVTIKNEEESHNTNENLDESKFVDRLVPFFATCVASNVRKTGGNSEAQAALIERYLRETRQALEKFREKAWRCEALAGSERCRNYWIGHEKGHQFTGCSLNSDPRTPLRRSGTSIESMRIGDFECSFDQEAVILALYTEIVRLLNEVEDLKAVLARTAQSCTVAQVSSYRTCYGCLKRVPIFILPCRDVQHTFCEGCLTSSRHDTGRNQSTLTLTGCLLGCHFKQGKPWRIRVKSPNAGARLLSLDGGGIRGIIELCILKRIEDEVGFGIPIQELFDVAFGTSTGGIIALGLFKQNWTIDKAIHEFERLSETAFSKRMWLKVPLFRHTAQLLYSHRFLSDGIESALKQAFGYGPLFGYNDHSRPDTVKVGVIASAPGGRIPFILANYSRDVVGDGVDMLVREENSNDELEVWEAGRSTSAAPTYFQPYIHPQTKREYIDGAMLRNNPVKLLEDERRLIWKDMCPPDIILSLGTGIQATGTGATKSGGQALKVAKRLVPKGLKGKVAVGLDMIRSTLDCEKQWYDFISSRGQEADLMGACHRINVGLSERPPNLDDVSAIPLLKWETEKYLRQEQTKYIDGKYKSANQHIRTVARRLTAALFYFEKDIGACDPGLCTGRLHCRLSTSVANSFESLVRNKLQFRLRQRVKNQGTLVSSISTKFDMKTFSSEVQFDITSDQYVIEMSMYQWSSWEHISGMKPI